MQTDERNGRFDDRTLVEGACGGGRNVSDAADENTGVETASLAGDDGISRYEVRVLRNVL